jgi:hypothetical protein
MILFQCLNCLTRVVNLQNEQPRSCKKCLSGSCWMFAIANDAGPVPDFCTDGDMATNRARWTPDRIEER